MNLIYLFSFISHTPNTSETVKGHDDDDELLLSETDTDVHHQSSADFVFIHSQKGKMQLKTRDGYLYVREKRVNDKVYWRCTGYTTKLRCHARMHTVRNKIVRQTQHNHKPAVTRNAYVKPEIDPGMLEFVMSAP